MFRTPYPAIAAALAASLLLGAAPNGSDDGRPANNPGIAGQKIDDGLPFFPKLRWEMTREQIRLAYPEVEDMWIVRGGSEKPNFHMLKIPRLVIDGCPFWVDLDFFNPPEDTLTEMSGNYDGPNVEDCLQRVRARFFDTFGPHPWNSGDQTSVTVFPDGTSEHTETTVSRTWNGKVTTIWFDVTTVLKTGKHRFRFVLQHAGAPGTYVE
jgi:hypothetical protein